MFWDIARCNLHGQQRLGGRYQLQYMFFGNVGVKYEINGATSLKTAAFTLLKIVFWDATPCGSCMNRNFGEVYRLHPRLIRRNVLQLLVTFNVFLVR
jgi:hypothetical protein